MSLLDAARPAAGRLAQLPKGSLVRVVAHYDPDGVASAAVAVQALSRAGLRFHVTYTYEHEAAYYESLKEDPTDATLFLDVGASLGPTLRKLPGLKIVLDHHPPGPDPGEPDLLFVNPHAVGLDGGHDACGATTSLAFAVALDPRNWDLAPHALAGAWGDKQDRGGLTGWNRDVLAEARSRGHVGLKRFPLLEDGPLSDLLTRAPPPWGAAFEASDDVAAVLAAHGLPPTASPFELEERDAEALASLLTMRLLARGFPAYRVQELFVDVPVSKAHQGRPIPRITGLLEAATREHEAGLGLAFLLGDASAGQDLESLESRYHERIRQILAGLTAERVKTRRAIHTFPVEGAAYTGTICGIAMEKLLAPTHATLAYSLAGDKARVSARGTPDLLQKGLNLSRALSEAAARHDGIGGGHAIASGATVPRERLEAFLADVDAIVAEQLGRRE